MNQNSILLAQGAQTTKIMYVGPKATKADTVSGYKPQMQFKRNEPVETPLFVAQALLTFDCFLAATDESIGAAKAADDFAAEQERLAVVQAEQEKQEELDRQKTFIEVDGESVDVAKLNFAQIQTLCLAQEIDVTREDGEDKIVLAMRVSKAFEEKQAAESEE